MLEPTLEHYGINGSIPERYGILEYRTGHWGVGFNCVLSKPRSIPNNGEIPATFRHRIEIGPVFLASDTVREGGLSHQ